MDTAADYDKIFRDRLLVITGVARSGTSIIEKIIGSFKDTYYSFEPVSFALIPPLIKKGYLPRKQGERLLKAILFEDIFLQMIHGRNINFNEKDDSYIGNFINTETIKKHWSELRGRRDVMEYLRERDHLFIVKNPNMQPLMELLRDLFPGIRFIHIIRDGNDVISSSIRKDFYSRDDLNKRNVDCWTDGEINNLKIPWYIKEKENFSRWNHHTRCAHIWRILNEAGIEFAEKNENRVMQVKLEDITVNPEGFVECAERFLERKRTDITERHLKSMQSYNQINYPDNTSLIEGPEKERYMGFRAELGYPVK